MLRTTPALLVLTALVAAGCGAGGIDVRVEAQPPPSASAAEATPTSPPTPEPPTPEPPTPEPSPAPAPTATPTATAVPTPAPSPTATPIPTAMPRSVHEQAFTPFASVGQTVLHHPARQVELIGLHESGHDGSKTIGVLDGAAPSLVLETRHRDTDPASAADVVVAPGTEIRSPVSGTVTSAGTYVLYCDYSDDLLYIEPDEHPGWQLRIFHIDGVVVAPGDRVEAGVTVVAPRATQLPFESQVDEHTAEPSWPHVHMELVDPSVPDRPTGPGCD